jgi:hypothetical protein
MFRAKRPKIFKAYKNLGGASTVARYQIDKDSVMIRFTDSSVYRYTNQSAGPDNISQMKKLALAGKGLGTFIESKLKDRFLQKVR